MFKNKLMLALDDAISNFNGGADENDSVVKAASAHGFNPEQTQRLVESFNTAKTICFYKNAEDRSGEFPTADPNAVIATLFGGVSDEKDAAPDDSYEDYSYYEKRHPELGKMASVTKDLDPWAGWGDKTDFTEGKRESAEKMADYKGLLNAIQACHNAATIVGNHHDMSIQKVAEAVSRKLYHKPGLANELHTYGLSLDKMAQQVIDSVFDELPIDRGECEDLKVSTFDVDFPMLASSVKSAAEARQEGGVMLATALDLEKTASEQSYGLEIRDAHEEELDSFIPKSAQQKSVYGDVLGSLAASVGKEATKGIVDSGKGVLSAGREEKNNKFTERARNQYRQLMLERLMITDPVLRGANENDVMQAYGSLVNLAPELSLKEDVTRSILREAVTTNAMSPYDAKTFVDLDSAIKKQLSAHEPKEVTKP